MANKGNSMDLRFKKLALLVMPSVVALAMTGCGSDSNDTSSFTADSDFTYAAPRITSYNVCYTKLLRDYGRAIAQLNGLPEVTEAHYTTGHYNIFIT